MKPVTRINRETLIAVLLVIAGIVLAFALFGAGVLWRSRASPKHLSAASPPSSRPDPSLKPLPLYERPLRPGFRALGNERAGGGQQLGKEKFQTIVNQLMREAPAKTLARMIRCATKA